MILSEGLEGSVRLAYKARRIPYLHFFRNEGSVLQVKNNLWKSLEAAFAPKKTLNNDDDKEAYTYLHRLRKPVHSFYSYRK